MGEPADRDPTADNPCPACGAAAGKRCRSLDPGVALQGTWWHAGRGTVASPDLVACGGALGRVTAALRLAELVLREDLAAVRVIVDERLRARLQLCFEALDEALEDARRPDAVPVAETRRMTSPCAPSRAAP